MPTLQRCAWCGDDPVYVSYHDDEWGYPVDDDFRLFEKICLGGFQAGLSWLTILRKREGYRKAYDQFDPEVVARYDQKKMDSLRQDAGIVRNRLKIEAAVKNARGYLRILDEHDSFSDYLWSFVGGAPIIGHRATLADIPARTPTSAVMSKELKKYDFKFVGPTICYAFMQAVGMVNDHTTDCFRYQQLK